MTPFGKLRGRPCSPAEAAPELAEEGELKT